MRKLLPVITGAMLLLAMTAWAADDSAMSGWIVDSKCGVEAAHAGNEACTKKCLQAGAKPVFVTDDKKEVLNLDNPDAVKGHEGQHVQITGTVTEGSLHVDSVKMLTSSGESDQH